MEHIKSDKPDILIASRRVISDELPNANKPPINPDAQRIQQELDNEVATKLHNVGVPDHVIKAVLPYTRRKHSRIHLTPGPDGYISTITVFLDDPTGATPPSPQYMIDIPLDATHGSRAQKLWGATENSQELVIDDLTDALLRDVSGRSE